MDVREAIAAAEAVLPGVERADYAPCPRWQAIIAVGEHVESEPDAVWEFVARWGVHPDDDLRSAIACCLLEHLLEYHIDRIFPRVIEAAANDRFFADTFARCWKFGQSELPRNSERFEDLKARCAMI